MSSIGTEFELRVGDAAHGGWCVGRHDEQVVFVRHTLPGERVRVRVTEQTKRFLRADAVEVLEASPDRVTPPCPYAGPGKCGGCDWQHAAPEAQRRIKAHVVAEQLRRIAHIETDVEVEAMPGDTDGLGWRTRVRFAVTADGTAGLRRHRSHEVQPVQECLIAHPEVNALGVPKAKWPDTAEVEAVVADRSAQDTQAVDRAVIVTPRGAKLAPLPELGASTAVLRGFKGGRIQSVRGRKGVRETAAGREWRVSAGGFWQGHPRAAEVLTDAVLAALAVEPGETALDLYCGAGLFAGALAEAVGPEGRVMGVEDHAEAARDAAHNLRDFEQVRVFNSDVETQLKEWFDLRADVVVLDPPRTGAGRAVVDSLAELRARRIAYVSCDPATLARDLAAFAERGYKLADLRAFDPFPMTHHVECVAVLARG